jgi:hypothetical protein
MTGSFKTGFLNLFKARLRGSCGIRFSTTDHDLRKTKRALCSQQESNYTVHKVGRKVVEFDLLRHWSLTGCFQCGQYDIGQHGFAKRRENYLDIWERQDSRNLQCIKCRSRMTISPWTAWTGAVKADLMPAVTRLPSLAVIRKRNAPRYNATYIS